MPAATNSSLRAVTDILQSKLVKRKVPLKGLSFGTITPAAASSVRQEVTLQQGIPIEKAQDIVKLIKDSKLKVQASIQSDLVRVAGKDRDTLQEVLALLRGHDFGIDCSSPITGVTRITGPLGGAPVSQGPKTPKEQPGVPKKNECLGRLRACL